MQKAFFLAVLLPFLLISCTTNKVSNESKLFDLSSKYYGYVYGTFNHDYSVRLFEFGQIVKKASEVKNERDIDYLKGRIDAFLLGKPGSVGEIASVNKEYLDKIIIPELQQPIFNLLNDMELYISNLDKIVEEKNFRKLKQLQEELKELYQLERTINDDRYRNPQEKERYLTAIEKMEKIMKK
ncbi:hypothetical protein [Carboxydothermus ferrireducens]|uniref:ABC-type amino acid transport substrate-binding protein n=1 Tax=Carboxydothermus ferrireducens DSM 11255 TaxID=1119529 RepID=A0ABX2RBD2_9THEO|nr:hypothetical protein [Carboxydothermus ferrireducens]NYE57098.1 ABC-type amino acid transport substrate-binding protein [Carboxydothermus ferrireducens DSM 11255]